jgi:Protein of unknown function (DUF3617)
MRNRLLLAAILLCSVSFWAADNITPLNAKVGLWEVTTTQSMSGMAAPNIPPDALAKLPPEQRAHVEEMLNGKPKVNKECVTKEKLEKNMAFNDNPGECTRTVLSSTGSKLNIKFHCEGKDKQSSSDGTFVMEVINTDSVKGTMHASTTNNNGRTMNMDFTINSKYLGPACGDVK